MNNARRGAVVAGLLACAMPISLQAKTGALPKVSVDSISAQFGRPDRITSTENDKPRPPLVTKFVEYRKEKVRFVLLADAPMGSPPPYKGWLLMGIQDTTTNKKLDADEVTKRMSARVAKK